MTLPYNPPEPTMLCDPPKRATDPWTCYTAGPHPDAAPPFGRCQHCGKGRALHSKVPVGALLIYSEVIADSKLLAGYEQRDPGGPEHREALGRLEAYRVALSSLNLPVPAFPKRRTFPSPIYPTR